MTLGRVARQVPQERLAFLRTDRDLMPRLQSGLEVAEAREDQPIRCLLHLTDTDAATFAAVHLGRSEENRCRARGPTCSSFSPAGRASPDDSGVCSAGCRAALRYA